MESRSRLKIPFMALAIAFGAAATGAAVLPAAAHAAVDQASAQQIGESLVEALNGRRADRRNWAADHIKSERIRGSEVEKLDRLALRLGDISLAGVRAADNQVALDIRDSRGRTGTIELTMDDGSLSSVLGVAMRGF